MPELEEEHERCKVDTVPGLLSLSDEECGRESRQRALLIHHNDAWFCDTANQSLAITMRHI